MNDFSSPLLDPDEQEHDSKYSPFGMHFWVRFFAYLSRHTTLLVLLMLLCSMAGTRKDPVSTQGKNQGH